MYRVRVGRQNLVQRNGDSKSCKREKVVQTSAPSLRTDMYVSEKCESSNAPTACEARHAPSSQISPAASRLHQRLWTAEAVALVGAVEAKLGRDEDEAPDEWVMSDSWLSKARKDM